MEMSHRSPEFLHIIEGAEALLRELLAVPSNYKVLFLQGGAWTQFAACPLNLAGVESGAPKKSAVYIDTGIWAAKSAEEAKKYVDVRLAASSKDKNYNYIPLPPPPKGDESYYYICLNNTIVGTRWPSLPESGIPLVADISSCVLSEKIDVSRFGLLFAGAQKNLGPAGLTVVIVREDLVREPPSFVPTMLRYDTHVKEKSLFNTPPCYSIYIMGLVLEWVNSEGGLAEIERRNLSKAAFLYDYLDNSRLFRALVPQKKDRSLMNVVFSTGSEALDKAFEGEARQNGIIILRGHRLVGGIRASIYNAMPLSGVEKLAGFMKDFEAKNVAR
jgi:phosphoserine aminotransferase